MNFIAELLGTFFFLFVIISTKQIIPIILALGIALYVAGGGHFNPAVSLMFLGKGELSVVETSSVIVAQVLGALLALLVYKYIK